MPPRRVTVRCGETAFIRVRGRLVIIRCRRRRNGRNGRNGR